MIEGWVKSFRKFSEWEWWSDDAVFRFFHGLLYLANLSDRKYKGKTIERGAFITSVPNLCIFFKMSEKKVRRCLKCLVSTGEIIDQPTNRDRKITITNYVYYQGSDNELPCQNRQGKGKGKGQGNGKGKREGKGNPIEERKKSVSLTEKHSEEKAKKPRASSALVERPGGGQEVTLRDVRQYQIDNRIGDAYLAAEFFHGFERSGTKFPKDWQDLYRKYVHATNEEQEKFSKILNSGGYRKKWGAVSE